MRTIVTGGAGFLGSHLCERLVDAGYYVHAIDNLSTGREQNLAGLFKIPQFAFEMRDVAAYSESFEVDRIYNLACPASPVHYQRDPVATTRTSVLGALRMLDLAHYADARILQASTSEVYGDPEVSPQGEGYLGRVNPIGPRGCYDEGKRCAETLFFDYFRQYQTEIKVVRIFNTYGPRMREDDGRVISSFIVSALRGDPLYVFGDGSQTRSFCYVDDLVGGLISMMASDRHITGPVNLGRPGEITMIQLAEKIIGMTRSNSRIVFRPLPIDDPRRRDPDISLAKTALGWTPKVSLDEGLDRTIHYFAHQLKVAA